MTGKRNSSRFRFESRTARVTRIPPLTFSWFNPELEQFQTTQSLPIACR